MFRTFNGYDEHGQKSNKPDANGISPRSSVIKQWYVLKRFSVGHYNDDFIRTTENATDVVQEHYRSCSIGIKSIGRNMRDGMRGCERLHREGFKEGLCPMWSSSGFDFESNYFFRMGQYQDWLIEYIEGTQVYSTGFSGE